MTSVIAKARKENMRDKLYACLINHVETASGYLWPQGTTITRISGSVIEVRIPNSDTAFHVTIREVKA